MQNPSDTKDTESVKGILFKIGSEPESERIYSESSSDENGIDSDQAPGIKLM